MRICIIQKTSGNLKKPPSDICEELCEDMWCELWRPFLSATSNASLPLMDRCTFQDNLDSRIFSIHYFHFKLQNFCKFKMYQISKFFAMDCMYQILITFSLFQFAIFLYQNTILLKTLNSSNLQFFCKWMDEQIYFFKNFVLFYNVIQSD